MKINTRYSVKDIYVCQVEIVDNDIIRDEIWPFYWSKKENRLYPLENKTEYYCMKEKTQLSTYLEHPSIFMGIEEIKKVIREKAKLGKIEEMKEKEREKQEKKIDPTMQDISLYEEEKIMPFYKAKRMKSRFDKAA